MNLTIHSLHVYPVKSCRGINLQTAELVDTGFKYDRHWMLVDEQGHFLSQRQLPQMAGISCTLSDENLIVTAENEEPLTVPLEQLPAGFKPVKIWNDECKAAIVSTQASAWFSKILGQSCELVYLPDSEKRQVDPRYAEPGKIVGFADGFPLLIVSLASIDVLNQKLEQKVSIDRFRPNIVIDGCPAHAEDDWHKIAIDDIEIQLAKPCSRCVIPSIDQYSSEKHPTILKALASYRRSENKIFFGQNGLHSQNGIIRSGQAIQLINE
jgi:uncharacterized protein